MTISGRFFTAHPKSLSGCIGAKASNDIGYFSDRCWPKIAPDSSYASVSYIGVISIIVSRANFIIATQ